MAGFGRAVFRRLHGSIWAMCRKARHLAVAGF
jgi:hypothetical protein